MAKVYKDISELKEPARTACSIFMSECKAIGLDIFITETYRSQERQNELYAQGRTKPGKVVTWTKTSNHSSRQAWDICFKSTGYNELSKFYDAGKVADILGITWGGNWKKQDLPHFEFKKTSFTAPKAKTEADSLSQSALKSGIISDKSLWYQYMMGYKVLSAGNLRALFSKILKKLNVEVKNSTLASVEASDLSEKAVNTGIISDKQLWYDYMVGNKTLTANNLRAFFTKVLNKVK